MEINFDHAGRASGELSQNDVSALYKALTAGTGTDAATFTGGRALQVQSLDHTMKATIAEEHDFQLMGSLVKNKIRGTVDEYTEQTSVGGFRMSASNTEVGDINDATGVYARRTASVKYLATRRQVSVAAATMEGIESASAVEQRNGVIELMTNVEQMCFEGDERVVPTEISGIRAQIEMRGFADTNIYDARAQSVTDVTLYAKASAYVAGANVFGKLTHIYLSQLAQADLDTSLDPAQRVSLTPGDFNSVQKGAPVSGIRTTWAVLKTCPDIFVRDGDVKVPFQIEQPELAAVAVANDVFKPANVTVTAASDVSSRFEAAHAGNYYWLVTGINLKGQSTGFITAQTAVAAGYSATLAITRSVGGTETGYVIYRGRLNGTNAVSDFREMVRIPANVGAGTTTYVDQNREIPGTTSMFLLTQAKGKDAISWQQFLPMFKFELAATAAPVYPWAQLLYGYLRLSKVRQHVVIKNVLPRSATWRPFNV